MNESLTVLDANIAFRLLCAGAGEIRDRLKPEPQRRFVCPRYLYVELFKHKDRLAAAARLPESELLEGLHALVSRLEFFSESNIPLGAWVEAYRLCRDVDENDTPYVALCLHLGARLWTADKELKAGLSAKGFNRFVEA